MEQYLVSARLFRPDSFSKVVGQQHVTTTLKNALLNKCLAQAFLFCGPRGVGKTTCARILAKAINCEKLTTAGEPCNICQACLRSQERDSGSVFELDGASNNSVDDIRLLVEQIRYVPQVGKYKVYIIDEVHMLSTSAFNAFLKTLEEPPKHAIFILATTEKHKIIPTVLSRCQVFDFCRVKTTDIVEHLAHVAHLRNVKFEKEALFILAERADGSIRDALSTFDMVSSFERSGEITYSGVIENLHIIDDNVFFELIENIVNGEVTKCFLQLKNLIENGFEWQNFITGLNKHLRNLLVCKYDSNYTALLETTEGKGESYKIQAGVVPLEFLFEALQKVNQCELDYKGSYNKQILVELMLLELSQIGSEKLLQKEIAETKNAEHEILIGENTSVTNDLGAEKILEKNDLKNLVEITGAGILDQSSVVEKKKPQSVEPTFEHKSKLKGKFSTVKILKITTAHHQPKAENDTIITLVRTGIESEKNVEGISSLGNESIEIVPCDTDEHPKKDETHLSLASSRINEFVKAYAHQFKTMLGMVKFNILLNSEISITHDEIEFRLTNPVEVDMLDEMKPDLVRFIKQRLNSTVDVRIVGVLAKNYSSEKKPYTKGEKFSLMEKKYPIVNKLMERFSLVLDGDVL